MSLIPQAFNNNNKKKRKKKEISKGGEKNKRNGKEREGVTIKLRATLQPSVPAPNNRQRVEEIFGRSSEGRRRHCINLRFKSTEPLASLLTHMKRSEV
jgi:hypothetical protein